MAAGETDLTLELVSTGLAYVRAGKARALAVTGDARSPQLPEVPNLVELGYPDLVVYTWQGLGAPAGTPPAIVAKLHRDLQAIKSAPELRERLVALGIEPFDQSPEDFTRFVRAESRRWGELIRKIGLKAE